MSNTIITKPTTTDLEVTSLDQEDALILSVATLDKPATVPDNNWRSGENRAWSRGGNVD